MEDIKFEHSFIYLELYDWMATLNETGFSPASYLPKH